MTYLNGEGWAIKLSLHAQTNTTQLHSLHSLRNTYVYYIYIYKFDLIDGEYSKNLFGTVLYEL